MVDGPNVGTRLRVFGFPEKRRGDVKNSSDSQPSVQTDLIRPARISADTAPKRVGELRWVPRHTRSVRVLNFLSRCELAVGRATGTRPSTLPLPTMFSRIFASRALFAAACGVCASATARADSRVALLNATTVNYASSASFSVTLATETPANYQWFKDGRAIPAALTRVLNIPFVELTDAGAYTSSCRMKQAAPRRDPPGSRSSASRMWSPVSPAIRL